VPRENKFNPEISWWHMLRSLGRLSENPMTTAALGFFNAPNLRRVRKAEAPVQHFVKADGLDTCLACWKDWMTGDQDKDLGMKTMRGLSGEEGHAPDIHEAQQDADHRIGAATDAMINSLSRIHVWAIYRSCSIATSWNFPNADFLGVAAEARDELTQKLKRNICTATLF
jgi:hypothetical protein